MFVSREKVEELKGEYPQGTRVRLSNMKGESTVPPGTDGTVTHVDDAGQIHVVWENGSGLALNVEVDSFEKIDPNEELGDKLYNKFACKLEALFSEIDFSKLNISCNNDDTSYAAEVLFKMHDTFEDVYDAFELEEEYGMVLLPAVVRGIETKNNCLALVMIDLESSGEHWGTTFLTPLGLITQGDPELTVEEEQFIRETYGCYDYWYTPPVRNDIHIDFENMPEQVIKIRAKVDELLMQRAESAAIEAVKGGQVLLE